MRFLKIAAILFFILMSASLSAQIEDDIYLDFALTNPNALAFPIGDLISNLNLLNTGNIPNYFTVQLNNQSTTKTYRLRLELQITYNGDQVALGKSDEFNLPPQSMNFFTSQQLGNGTAPIAGQMVAMEFDPDDVSLDLETLKDQALATGNLPSGQWNFILRAVNVNGEPNEFMDDDESNNILNIANPTYIELLFPGRSVNDPTIEEVSTTTPYCQWQTDVPPSNASYNIYFYEKQSEDISVQDVLNHPPIFKAEGYANNFLQYPTDTSIDPVFQVVRPLEAGNTYYWFVRSTIQTGTGNITLESDIFRFKISDVAETNYNAQQIVTILQQLLGPQYELKLTELIEQGFDPNGEISLDGQSGDISTLLEIANKISSGQLNIEDVEIY